MTSCLTTRKNRITEETIDLLLGLVREIELPDAIEKDVHTVRRSMKPRDVPCSIPHCATAPIRR